MAANFPDAQSAGTVIGPLVLAEAVAQGGEGIVYAARHARHGEVMVKEFWPKQIVSRAAGATARAAQDNWQMAYRDGVAQFMRLGQRLIALPPHPGIMRALEVFEANNTAYLVTERINGRTLDDALEAGAFTEPDEILQLADRLTQAMAHLHDQGLFHRDLAPDNIIITAGYDWQCVLIDFNAAKDIVQKVSRSHDGIVKPGYTAIEQYAIDGKEPIGPWTDIYSASAVLYRCITGQAPADPAIRLLRPGKSENLAASFGGRFDANFLAAIDRGLEPHPDNRPQSVSEWRSALGLDRKVAEPAAPPAPPPPPPPPTPPPPPPAPRPAAPAAPPLGLLKQPAAKPSPRKTPAWPIAVGLALGATALAWAIWSRGPEGAGEATASEAATDFATDTASESAAALEPTAPVPLKSMASLVRPDDYPSTALANEETGSAGFELTIGPDGKPTACRITSSSGSASLDKATCAVLQPRARFEPARDAGGQAVEGSYSGKVTWKLSDPVTPRCDRGPYVVYFDFDSSQVTPTAATTLNIAIANWSNCGQPNVVLTGYAGDAASSTYAVGFSERRASAVKDYMTGFGIPESSISPQGMGKSGTSGSGPKSRRVEIIFR